ncbi:winged helix-turn-helix transcriptional regulator [Microtetraspora niveoalba]|uniref:winged helix-turn-helix transcriptional regulator n=1 Tax=Microtetraspora niveoalba TaxID=46175 RepID=UPI001FE20D2E|nr:helix-turn-helix domain-containing protein [Microtetraspora niveoalba]
MTRPLDPDMFAGCAPVRPPIQIGGKWTVKIIACLAGGPRRFSELLVPLRDITPKTLTASLRSMERDGLVSRTAYAENPPRVEYALTSLGRTLFDPLAAACAWTSAHLPELLAARAAHDAGP